MKYINFFSQGEIEIESTKDFEESDVFKYLTEIYGPLEFRTDEHPINFIDVYDVQGKTYVLDTMFNNATAVLTEFRKGYYFPERFKHLIIEGQKELPRPQFIPPLLNSLSKFGFAPVWKPNSLDIQTLRDQKWTQLSNNIFDSDNNYDVVEEYLATQTGTLEFLNSEREAFMVLLATSFGSNLLIRNIIGHSQSRAQRMREGNELVPHFDADRGEPYVFSGLNWYVDSSNFSGRDLTCGARTETDLRNFINKFLYDKEFTSYHEKIENFKQVASFSPVENLTLLVNTANPIFYHSVTKMKGEGSIYTIINDCRLHND